MSAEATSSASGQAPASRPQLVGRSSQVAHLDALVGRIRDDRLRVAVVTGESAEAKPPPVTAAACTGIAATANTTDAQAAFTPKRRARCWSR